MSFASENNPEKTTPNLTLADLEKWVAAWDPSRFSRNAKLQSLALQKRELAEKARDQLKFCYEVLLLPNEATIDEAEELCRQNLQNWDASRFDGESRRAIIAEQKRIRFQDVLNRLNSARSAQQSLGDFGNSSSPNVTSLFTSGRSEESKRKEVISQAETQEEISQSSTPFPATVGAGLAAMGLTGFTFPDPDPEAEDDGLKAHQRFRQIREERQEAQEIASESQSNFVSKAKSNYISSESEDENWKTSETSEAQTESVEIDKPVEAKEVLPEVAEPVEEKSEAVEPEASSISAEPEPESESEPEPVEEPESIIEPEPVKEEATWIPPIPEIVASELSHTEHSAQVEKNIDEQEPSSVEEEDGPVFENPDEAQGTSLFERAILNLQSHQTDQRPATSATDAPLSESSPVSEEAPSASPAFEPIPEAGADPDFSTAAISKNFSLSDFKQSIEEETSAQSGISGEPLQSDELEDIFTQTAAIQPDEGILPEQELPTDSIEETSALDQESYQEQGSGLGMEMDPSIYGGYEMEYAPHASEAEIEEPVYETPVSDETSAEDPAAATEDWTQEYAAADEDWTEGAYEATDSQPVEFYEEPAQANWSDGDSQDQNYQESQWEGDYSAESYTEDYSSTDNWNAQEDSGEWQEEAPVAGGVEAEGEWDSSTEQQSSEYQQEVAEDQAWEGDQGFDHQQDTGYGDEIAETEVDVSESEVYSDSPQLEHGADQYFDESDDTDEVDLEGSEEQEEEFVEEEYSEAARAGGVSTPIPSTARVQDDSDDFLADESDEEENEEDLELFDEMAGMLDRPKRFQSKIMTFVGAIAVLLVLGGSVAGYYYFSQQNTDIEALMEDGGELDNTLAGNSAPSWQDPEDDIPFGNNDAVEASQPTPKVVEPVEEPAMTAAEAFALGQQLENSGGVDSIQQAMDAYEIAASQGMARAQFRLGTLYFEGAAGTPNYTKAAEWYRKAAEIGMPEAQFHLACMALHQPGGPGIVKDNPADWLRMASEQEYTNAKVNLALLYLDGAGSTPRDPNLAAYLLRQSADQGNPLGQALLGMMYDRGEGVLADSSKAMEWYQKAVERDPLENPMDLPGLPEVTRETSWEILRHAQKVLASKLLKTTDADSGEQVEQAKKLLESAAETKDPQAQFQLGLLYCDAEIADTDYPQAKKWFQEAADANYPPAWVNLGWMYENGFGVEKDYQKAEENYLKAVDAGDSLGQYRLGLLYLYGVEGLPSDEVKAYQWIKAAANNGAQEAKVKLEEWEREMRDSGSQISPSAMEAWQILDSLESGDAVSGAAGDYSELETASSTFNGYSIVSVLKYL